MQRTEVLSKRVVAHEIRYYDLTSTHRTEEIMGHYRHLTIAERENIMMLRRDGDSISLIAAKTGRSKSTISRELRRNAGEDGEYRASTAQERYKERRKACRRSYLLDDSILFDFVSQKFLEEQWSPEQITGRMALEWGHSPISTTTIYRGINAGRFDGLLGGRKAKRKLRHRGKKRRRKGEEERRGKIKNARSIEERPSIVETRERLGDWEGDTVLGKTGGACLVTNVDRKSGILVGGKAEKKTAEAIKQVQIRSMRGHILNSMTMDRGKEFAKHEELSNALGVDIYFALPHHPWQRGSNENTNGLLREYFPKGQSLDKVSDEEVQEVFDKLNHRPRKRHGYRTPHEVYYGTQLRLL